MAKSSGWGLANLPTPPTARANKRLQRQPWSQLHLLGGKQVRIKKNIKKSAQIFWKRLFCLGTVQTEREKSISNQAYWTGSLLSVTLSHMLIKKEHSAPRCTNRGIFPINEASCMHKVMLTRLMQTLTTCQNAIVQQVNWGINVRYKG